ncbi:MAG: Arm DNA-binding domain-containing protein, partial [Nitrospira sp.]|nr:Arm DNA-binding domain-containing protein [Nitrospira sp.]
MAKLTKKIVDAISHPPAGQIFVRDEELRGFALRVTPGSKSFVVEREIRGRVRRMTIGRYGVFTVDQARDEARKKIGEIAKGNDPVEAKQRERRDSITFGELEQLYLERHAVHKKSASND